MKREIEIILKRDGKEVTRQTISTFKEAIERLVFMWIVFDVPDVPKD